MMTSACVNAARTQDPTDNRIRALSVVYNFFLGGHENRLLALARTIDRSVFNYSVLSVTVESEDPVERTASMRPPYIELGIPVEDLGEKPSVDPNPARLKRVLGSTSHVWRIIRKLVKYIRQHRIEVIDAHHTTAMFAAVIAGRAA